MSATGDLDALVEEAIRLFHGGNRDRMTRPEETRCYGLCRVLLIQVGATPGELRRAARAYQSRYTVGFGLKAVFERWSELLAEPPSSYKAWVPRVVPGPVEGEKERVADLLGQTRRQLRAV